MLRHRATNRNSSRHVTCHPSPTKTETQCKGYNAWPDCACSTSTNRCELSTTFLKQTMVLKQCLACNLQVKCGTFTRWFIYHELDFVRPICSQIQLPLTLRCERRIVESAVLSWSASRGAIQLEIEISQLGVGIAPGTYGSYAVYWILGIDGANDNGKEVKVVGFPPILFRELFCTGWQNAFTSNYNSIARVKNLRAGRIVKLILYI